MLATLLWAISMPQDALPEIPGLLAAGWANQEHWSRNALACCRSLV
jgi:hypothetical protein